MDWQGLCHIVGLGNGYVSLWCMQKQNGYIFFNLVFICLYFLGCGATGAGENVKCEVGDKETVLQLLQDIQLVTLPETNSSVWSDLSQSQSPMTLISDSSTISNLDPMPDPSTLGLQSAPPFWVQSSPSTSSLLSCPLSGSNTTDRYDFMPGSENLLCAPNTPSHSPWFFVGFEPDASGVPLDLSAVVCKLCGNVMSCEGGPAEVQNHLLQKHRIKTCQLSSDQTGNRFNCVQVIKNL